MWSSFFIFSTKSTERRLNTSQREEPQMPSAPSWGVFPISAPPGSRCPGASNRRRNLAHHLSPEQPGRLGGGGSFINATEPPCVTIRTTSLCLEAQLDLRRRNQMSVCLVQGTEPGPCAFTTASWVDFRCCASRSTFSNEPISVQ